MAMEAIRSLSQSLPPGFGFHPSDVELFHYLRRKVLGLPIDLDIIPELDIYKHEPWDLSATSSPLPSLSGSDTNSKWHFFTPRDRKYPNGSRSNRTTQAGYWKSTGKDRAIRHHNRTLGTKKTLVFHCGRPPSGTRTEWIMHEYYLHQDQCKDAPHLKDLFVLCRVTKRDADRSKEVPAPNQLGADQLTPAAVNPVPIVPDSSSTLSETPIATSSTNNNYQAEDIEKWLQDLFDPNFTADSILPELQQHATTPVPVGSNPSAPKPEPLYYSPGEGSEEESTFLFQEDIQSILGMPDHQNTQNLSFLEDETAFTSSTVDTNLLGYTNDDDGTGIVIRRRSTSTIYGNPNDADVSNINKYNLKSKLQVHLYKKEEKILETANFAPTEGLVDEFDSSGKINGKISRALAMGTVIFGALLIAGIAALFYFVSDNSTIFS